MNRPQSSIEESGNAISIIDGINGDMKTLMQRGIGELTQREYEEQIGGGRVANVGAIVVSVEGETWREGLNAVEGRGKIGRFWKSEEFNELVKITFTKPNGLFIGESDQLLPPEKRIMHPLSKVGFYVPKEGGWITLDDGWLLLVSKTGIFSGRGGWGKAREMHEKWVMSENNNQSLMDRTHGLTTQLKHTEDQLMMMSAAREDFQLWAQDKEQKFQVAYQTLGKMRNSISSLHSELEGMQWINTHQEQTIKDTLSKLDVQCRELRIFVQDDKMFDTLREASSKIPDLSPYRAQGFKDRMKRAGLMKDDPQEKLIQEQKKAIENLTKEKMELQQAQQQKQLPPAPPQSPSGRKEQEGEEDEDEKDIVSQDDDDEQEEGQEDEQKQEEPPAKEAKETKPEPPKQKKKLGETVKGVFGKIKQDAKEFVGKSVQPAPKEQTEPEPSEDAPEDQTQDDGQEDGDAQDEDDKNDD